MRDIRAMAGGLRSAIERSGYYPGLVADAVSAALGSEAVVSYVVHHDAVFDPAMEVRRHMTVLVLTPTRLVHSHTDEHPAEEPGEPRLLPVRHAPGRPDAPEHGALRARGHAGAEEPLVADVRARVVVGVEEIALMSCAAASDSHDNSERKPDVSFFHWEILSELKRRVGRISARSRGSAISLSELP